MKFWNLKNDAGSPGDGVLEIDGEIVAEKGWFDGEGVCVAREFRKALQHVKNVTVRINSPGGDVIAGAEIYSALREHSLNGAGSVTVIITALAASAASIIAMAGDRILMHPVAYMMIHNPWTIAAGDAKELRKTAKTLDEIGEGLISAYQIRTGKSRDELKRMLENETWMSAATCVEEGFADEIYGTGSVPAAALANLAKPTMMSAKAHGVQEIAARIRDEDPEEEPDEEETKDPETEPEEKPDEEEAKALKLTVNGITPEEEPKRAEIARRAEIALRASAAAEALR